MLSILIVNILHIHTYMHRLRVIHNSVQYTNTRMSIVRIQYTRTLLIRNTLAELITFGSLLLRATFRWSASFRKKKFTLTSGELNFQPMYKISQRNLQSLYRTNKV